MRMISLLSDDEVNVERQVTLDYLKCLSISFMIVIHVYEEISVYPDVNPGILGTIIEFLGGPLAAPLFMFSMGIGMAYSHHHEPMMMFKRGIRLFVFAYVLNFVRDGIREIVYGLCNGGIDWEYVAYCVFNVDILHFAGLTFMFLALMKKWKAKIPLILIIAIIMQAVGNFLLQVEVTNPVLKYVLGLFMYTGEAACFPFLMWFIYPTLGLLYGMIIRQVKDRRDFYKVVQGLCMALFVSIRAYVSYSGVGAAQFYSLTDDIYYKQNLMSTLYTVSVFGFVIATFYFLRQSRFLKRFEKQAIYIGNNLNEIYINQWLIIGLLGFLFEFELVPWLSYIWVIPVALVIYSAAIALAKYTRVFVKKFL